MYRAPERGMSTYPPPSPQGWLTAVIRAQRRERSSLAAFLTGTTVIVWRTIKKKKKVIALFDLVFADQSKQDTF